MFLTRAEKGEVRLTLRVIARSGLGWYPQKTILIHPAQLHSLEILIKRARGLLAEGGARANAQPEDPKVVRLPYFNCPAVADD